MRYVLTVAFFATIFAATSLAPSAQAQEHASPAPAGQEPPGWQWVWELEAQGSDATVVRLTYDWSGVTDEELKKQIGFPLVSEDQLEATLDRLAQAVAT